MKKNITCLIWRIKMNEQSYKNKINYINQYKRERTKPFILYFNKEKDDDILDYLESQVGKGNKSEYIKKLIRADMKKRDN